MSNDLYKVVTRPDGRLSFELVVPRATWREHALHLVASVGIAAGLYIVALAFVWHL